MTRWTQTATTAQLTVGEWTATLDLLQPRLGLHAVRCGNAALGAASLLGVDLVLESAAELSLPETYVRGDDLVATYAATAARPWRVQAYWRVVEVAAAPNALVVELQVSISTALLDARPHVDIAASLPGANPQAEADDRFGFALDFSTWDYWQAVHPDDPCATKSTIGAKGLQFSQRLFDRFLEKGVILRARIRGALVPRGTDVDAIFAEFAAAPLPLTT